MSRGWVEDARRNTGRAAAAARTNRAPGGVRRLSGRRAGALRRATTARAARGRSPRRRRRRLGQLRRGSPNRHLAVLPTPLTDDLLKLADVIEHPQQRLGSGQARPVDRSLVPNTSRQAASGSRLGQDERVPGRWHQTVSRCLGQVWPRNAKRRRRRSSRRRSSKGPPPGLPRLPPSLRTERFPSATFGRRP